MKKTLVGLLTVLVTFVGAKAFAQRLDNSMFKNVKEVDGYKKGNGNGGGDWTSFKPKKKNK